MSNFIFFILDIQLFKAELQPFGSQIEFGSLRRVVPYWEAGASLFLTTLFPDGHGIRYSQIAGLLKAILRPIAARRNEIRLAADYAGSQNIGLAASKRWNSSLGLIRAHLYLRRLRH